MDIVFVALCLFGYCFSLTKIFNIPITTVPFLLISSIITLLYVAAYFHILPIITYIVLSLGAISLFSIPFILRRDRKVILVKYLTPGFIVTIFCMICLSFLSLHQHFAAWDEFSHWGPHAKLLYINNGFWTAENITVHKSYPPGGALFYYLFDKAGGFSEVKTYIAQQLMILSSLPILLQRIRWKEWPLAFIGYLFGLIVFIHLNVKMGLSGSLYMDSLAGIWFGAIIIYYRSSKQEIADILRLIPPVVALSLFKLKLFPLILVITTIILVDQMIQCFIEHRTIKKKFLIFGSIILLPIISQIIIKSWYHYLLTIKTKVDWVIALTPQKLVNLFTLHNLTKQNLQIITNFYHASYSILLTVFPLMVLVIMIGVLMKTKKERIFWFFDNSIIIFSFIAYLVGLLIMYLYVFSVSDGVDHAAHLVSFERYLNIFYLAWWLVICYGIVQTFSRNRLIQSRKLQYSLIFIMLVVFFLGQMIVYQPERQLASRNRDCWLFRQEIQRVINKVKKHTKKSDNIFIIFQGEAGFNKAILAYELVPRNPNLGISSFGAPYSDDDIWTLNVSPKQFLKQLSHYNYLLLGYTDKKFWNTYGKLFPAIPPTLKPLASYTVCVGQGFGLMRQSGCRFQTFQSYLFKITRDKNKLKLKNVV
jgi:hypothetical protein